MGDDSALPPWGKIWLGQEPDSRDLIRPFSPEQMRRPISTRVSKPENDGPSIPDRIQITTEAVL